MLQLDGHSRLPSSPSPRHYDIISMVFERRARCKFANRSIFSIEVIDPISILTKIFLGLVQGCTRLYNRHKTKSCKCHKLCPNSDKLPHRNRSRVSHAYYIVSASLKVHWYTSRTCPESLSNCLFADVVVIVINDIHGYSSFPLHWATLKYVCACLFTQLVP